MKKITILLIACILLIPGAMAFPSTEEYEPGAYPDEVAYKVTYDIKNPGWYLLPHLHSLPGLHSDTGDFKAWHYSYDYKYALSPFTKKYIRCERTGSSNPMRCDLEQFYGTTLSDLESLTDTQIAKQYVSFSILSADWYYFSKPFKVVFDYRPSQLFSIEEGDDDVGLYGAKVKAGWNLIIWPSYAAYSHVDIQPSCKFEKAYWFDATAQEWDAVDFPSHDALIKDLTTGGDRVSGMPLAVKMQSDCRLFYEKSEPMPPPMPN